MSRVRITQAVAYDGGQVEPGAELPAETNEGGHAWALLPDGRRVSIGRDEFVWLDFGGFYEQSWKRGCAAFAPQPDRDIVAAIDRYIDAPASVQTTVWREALARLVALLRTEDVIAVLEDESNVLKAAAERGANEQRSDLRSELRELRKVLDETISGPAGRMLGVHAQMSDRGATAIRVIDELLRSVVTDPGEIPF